MMCLCQFKTVPRACRCQQFVRDGTDIFIEFEGVRIAQRGSLGNWTSVPGWTVTENDGDEGVEMRVVHTLH
jgi:hypothetical protein